MSLADVLTYIPDLTGQVVKDDKYPVTPGGVWNVWKYQWQLPPEYPVVAVKVSRFVEAVTASRVRREIKVWGRLQHQHILPLVGFIRDLGVLPSLVSPWMVNGNLVQFLDEHTITRCQRFLLLQDVASALQYLHSTSVIHGNLTGNNILIDQCGRALVADVGISTLLDEITESEIGMITSNRAIPYAAPEILNVLEHCEKLPTPKSDMWSFGCNMIHVLSGKKPWYNMSNMAIILRLQQGHQPALPCEAPQVSYFLEDCFSFRPEERPSADQALCFVSGELSCINPAPLSAGAAADGSQYGIPDVMNEFKRRVSNQMPSHLIYIPKMRLVSRDELADIVKPETITEQDISQYGGWSREYTIQSKLVPDRLKYAILSHRWGRSEPTFQDLTRGRFEGVGYRKLLKLCEKAKEYGCDFVWSDTCCINKESSSELDEAIRSMYKWYSDAHICIVQLAQSQSLDTLHEDKWFTRGWTLQELLAPSRIKFYGSNWTPLTNNENDKDDTIFVSALSKLTGIPLNDLCNFRPGPNRAWEKMTWAANRKTTRVEDIAYSLTGIFDISMTIAYGEGDRAFRRFMAELLQNCKEWQILVWARGLPGSPTEPACYFTADNWARDVLKQRQISWWGEGSGDSDFSVTKRGVQVKLLVIPVSVDETFEKWIFFPKRQLAGQYEAAPFVLSPLEELHVLFHYFPPASATEWAVAIVNYRHYVPNKGKLKRGEKYMCFLLRRLRRLGTNVAQDDWRREVTKEILTVDCANDFNSDLETIWL